MRASVPFALSLVLMALFALSPEPAHGQREEANIVYGMHYGTALLMDVAYPDSANGYGIVLIPGSGWHAQGGYDTRPLKAIPRQYYNALTTAGFTVFRINHRAAPAFRYPAAVQDAQRAVRFIRHNAERFDIIPHPLGAFGGSSGAHLVSMLGVLDGHPLENGSPVDRQSAKVQCVAALSAPTNLSSETWWSRAEGFGPVSSFIGYPPPINASLAAWEHVYREASPVTHISEDDASFLLMHGQEDRIVPVEQSVGMRDSLAAAGVPVELRVISGKGHGIGYTTASDSIAVPWFDQCLHLNGPSEK